MGDSFQAGLLTGLVVLSPVVGLVALSGGGSLRIGGASRAAHSGRRTSTSV